MTDANFIIAQDERDKHDGWDAAASYVDSLREPQTFAELMAAYRDFLERDGLQFDLLVPRKQAKAVRRWFKYIKAFDPELYRKLLPFRTGIGLIDPKVFTEELLGTPFDRIVAEDKALTPSAPLRARCSTLIVQALFGQIEDEHLMPEDYNFDYLVTKPLSATQEAWLKRGAIAYLCLLQDDEGKAWTENLASPIADDARSQQSIERTKLNFDVRLRNINFLLRERAAQAAQNAQSTQG